MGAYGVRGHAGAQSRDTQRRPDHRGQRLLDRRRGSEAATARIKGPAGTKVRLRVVTPPRKRGRSLELSWQRIEVPVAAGRVTTRRPQAGGPAARVHRGRPRPAPPADRPRRRPGSRTVLDLRGNGGGLLREAVLVSSIFVDSGEIVSVRGAQPEQPHRAGHRRDRPEDPRGRARRSRQRQRLGDHGRRAAPSGTGPRWSARGRSARGWCRRSSRCRTAVRSTSPWPTITCPAARRSPAPASAAGAGA